MKKQEKGGTLNDTAKGHVMSKVIRYYLIGVCAVWLTGCIST